MADPMVVFDFFFVFIVASIFLVRVCGKRLLYLPSLCWYLFVLHVISF